MSADDLGKLLAEKREALRQFRFGQAGSRVRNTKEGRILRRTIARILTKKATTPATAPEVAEEVA